MENSVENPAKEQTQPTTVAASKVGADHLPSPHIGPFRRAVVRETWPAGSHSRPYCSNVVDG